jgi:hypothetical protein
MLHIIDRADVIKLYSLFTTAQQPAIGPRPTHCCGFTITLRYDTPHSVELLWTTDQPVADGFQPNNTQHSQKTDIHAAGGIRTQILASEWPQKHALDRAITRIGSYILESFKFGGPAPKGR